MARRSTNAGFRQIDRLFDAGTLVGLSDRQLLERFVAGESAEAAFEALVDRHGPMVRSVCRSMLGGRDDADDAFQATFLVLARCAGTIRSGDALGSWLYGVACRVSARARADAGRRRMLERYLVERARVEPSGSDRPRPEPMPEVLEELERLPERYRAPIVLCYLEGRSHEQAAGILGCAQRTVETRLRRGRARLKDRLVRRGLAPAAGLAGLGIDTVEAAAIGATAVPAALTESTARASVQFAAAHAAGLGGSAIGLAQGVLKSLFWTRLKRTAGMAMGLLVGLSLALAAWAAVGQQQDEPAAATVAGRVLDEKGQPIAGADVWLPVKFDDPPEITPHATSDAQGRYILALPARWKDQPVPHRNFTLWAYAKDQRLAAATAWKTLTEKKPEPVDITLGPATDTAFRVIGPDGRPAVGATVEPYHFRTPRAYEFLPAALLKVVRASTDASGRAALPALPREGFYTVQVMTGATGVQRLRLRDLAAEPAEREIRLRPAGRIEGQVVADRPEWAKGMEVYLITSDPGDPSGMGLDRTAGYAQVTTGPDGTFVVPAIAGGRLWIMAGVDNALPVRPRLPQNLDIPAGQSTRVEIPLVPAVKVAGVIRVAGSGQPVKGASISVGYGAPRQSDQVETDAQGRFTANVLPGDVTMHVISLPDGLVQLGEPWAEKHRVPEGKTFDLPAIEVVKGLTITGRVVDLENRPVADVSLNGISGNRRYGFGKTDEKGAFSLSDVPAGLEMSYQVWPSDHENPVDAQIVTREPLALRVDLVGRLANTGKPGVPQVSGTVVDADGQPVAGAEVTLTVSDQNRITLPRVTTDEKGVYHHPGRITKGNRYRAIVSPGKYAIAATPEVISEGTDSITLPPVSVMRLRTIAGRVVDTEGRPVAGARVLGWGSPAPLSSAVTGSTGRFQLDGFSRGPAWLFVDAPGYQFHRDRPDPGKSIVELVVRRRDQPPERGVASLGPPISHERAVRLAASVLKPYAERILQPGTDNEARSRAISVAALIDPEGAWRKAPWDCNPVRIAVARHLIRTRPDEAEAILPTITSTFWRQDLTIDLADALPARDRARKVAILKKLAGQELEAAEKSGKFYHLGEATRRLLALSDAEDARKILNDTLPIARKADGGAPGQIYTRGLLGPLARLELKDALPLIPTKGDERTINDFRGLIAQAIADLHPAEAERLIGAMTWNNSESYSVKTCRRMAKVDLERAHRIAGQIKIVVLRAYALGRMAEEVAAKDRAAARALRDEAFRVFGESLESGPGGVWGSRSAAVMAAALLPGIERDDPDHLAEAVDRVISLRWYPRRVLDLTSSFPDTSQIEGMRADAALAAILARYDHELARSIAGPIIDRLKRPLPKDDERFFNAYAVLPCLALADPEATARLVEVIPDPKENGGRTSRDVCRQIVAEALAQPEAEFWTIIRGAFSDLEIVERED
ncbi:MAG: sigma-70 family RNA polymerase sigma factor [Isosphaeraceae bacterium]